MNNSLLSRIISSSSGLLNTVNQVIPLYEEIKPIIKKIASFKKNLNKLNLNKIFNNSSITENKIKEEKPRFSSSNPQFFL